MIGLRLWIHFIIYSMLNIGHNWEDRSSTMTLLSNVDSQNITVGCWEFNLNPSLVAQLFEHLTIIFRGPTKWDMHVEWCYDPCIQSKNQQMWTFDNNGTGRSIFNMMFLLMFHCRFANAAQKFEDVNPINTFWRWRTRKQYFMHCNTSHQMPVQNSWNWRW